jgi:hypothetical protein
VKKKTKDFFNIAGRRKPYKTAHRQCAVGKDDLIHILRAMLKDGYTQFNIELIEPTDGDIIAYNL